MEFKNQGSNFRTVEFPDSYHILMIHSYNWFILVFTITVVVQFTIHLLRHKYFLKQYYHQLNQPSTFLSSVVKLIKFIHMR